MRQLSLCAILVGSLLPHVHAGETDPRILAFSEAQRKTAEAYERLSFKVVLETVSQDETFGKPLQSTTSVSISRRGGTCFFSHEQPMQIQAEEIREGRNVVAHDYRIVEGTRASRVLLTDELSVAWQDLSVPMATFTYGPGQNKRESGRQTMHLNHVLSYAPARFSLGLGAPLFEQITLHPEYTTWEVREVEGGNLEIKRVMVDTSGAIAHTLLLVADAEHGNVFSATGTHAQGAVSTATVEFGEIAFEGGTLPVPVKCEVKHVDSSGVVAESSTVTYSDFRDESKEPVYTIADLGLPENCEILAIDHPTGHPYFMWSGGELKPIAELNDNLREPTRTDGPAVRVPVESDSARAKRPRPTKVGN